MATKYYLPEDKTPLPPKSAEVLTTCCDYCIVACGYKVYRWPVGVPNGGMKASENAFGVDFPSGPLQAWVAPTQHNVVMHKGRPHNVVVIPDKDAKVVNISGDSSIRGGTIAQKCYNPDKPTNDRLMSPMIRINGTLQPVSWDMALDVATDLMKYTVKQYGANAYGMKIYSYQFVENTYAGSKFARRSMKTANWTMHDTPANVTSTPGFRDAGFDNFGPAYKDWGDAEVLMICGTDPYETKTMIFNQFMKPAI
ncbi:MAG: molybdopterin-dependent oxidoreductase, partial [Candidatus Thiodiazotropha sp.]